MVVEGAPSETARRVAARRLLFERLAAPYGDPSADEMLARDVAGGQPAQPGEGLWSYLKARTTFFDRAVVNAMDRGNGQIVNIGAGYDARPWRYAKPGVTWWEIDYPPTQADKRARLERLGIPSGHVHFVPFDLRYGGLAAALASEGFEPDAPALFVCEGVAVYLDVDVLESVFQELRSLATIGTRFAISLGVTEPPAGGHVHERFAGTVESLGEPARARLTSQDVEELLAWTRWRGAELSERARAAGFVVAAPVWAPAISQPAAPTRGYVGQYLERALHRIGGEHLAAHLDATYGTKVRGLKELDLGVYRVDLEGKERWVGRLFPATRPLGQAQGDAETLNWLRSCGIPAEVPANSAPVSSLYGQPLLMTRLVPGSKAKASPEVFSYLGHLLGRMHNLHNLQELPPVAKRVGGAWHHLAPDEGLAEEASACKALLTHARHRAGQDADLYDALATDVSELTAFHELPHAFGHADLVPNNVIGSGPGSWTIIDWAGSGWSPRISSLGCLLWSAVTSGRDALLAAAGAYRQEVGLSPEELGALHRAVGTRPLVLAAWSFATGRMTLQEAARNWGQHRRALAGAMPEVLVSLGP